MKVSSLAIVTALFATSTNAFSPIQPHSTTPIINTSQLHATPPSQSNFLTPELPTTCIATAQGTPLYAYSLSQLAAAATATLAFPNAFGLTVRYAMKACPNGSILKYFLSRGICIDASSGYEVRRAMSMGVPAEKISLSSQELPADFDELIGLGVKINAW